MPFFKTVTVFFVLFAEDSKLESVFYCVIKCLPIISLIVFVLLHGMSFSEYYSYSRKILLGLIFSCLGDIFLVWKNHGYFIHGILCFAVAQIFYAAAFGFRPFNPYACATSIALASTAYMFLWPGLSGIFLYVGVLYCTLIFTMAWRAIARVKFLNDMWTWTGLCSCFGAVFFLISDFIIAVDKFRFHVPYAHPLIMFTYYAAQLGISLSVVDSQVDALLDKTRGKSTNNHDTEVKNGEVQNGLASNDETQNGSAINGELIHRVAREPEMGTVSS